MPPPTSGPPRPRILIHSKPIGRLLPIQRRRGRCIALHPSIPIPNRYPPPSPSPFPSLQCRLPASSAPGIPELEVAVDDQLSEFSERRIGGVALGPWLVGIPRARSRCSINCLAEGAPVTVSWVLPAGCCTDN